MVCAWRVCQAQLLCKVSYSQLSLLQRNALSLISRLNIKFWQSPWGGMKCRSKAPGHGAWLLSVSEGRLLCKVSYTQLSLFQRNALYLLDVNFLQSQWSMKCRSRAQGHGVWLLSVSRMIAMQGSILPDITVCRKIHFISRLDKILTKSVDAWNVSQGHQVMVRACKSVVKDDYCAKVSYSQISLLQRNALLFSRLNM